MLRAALALLSTLQIGARISNLFQRSLRQAVVIAVAAALLIAAAVFGLLAAYHMLVSIYQFSPVEAAAIMAGVACCSSGLSWSRSCRWSGRQPKLRLAPPPPRVVQGRWRRLDRSGRRQSHAAGRSRAPGRHRFPRWAAGEPEVKPRSGRN